MTGQLLFGADFRTYRRHISRSARKTVAFSNGKEYDLLSCTEKSMSYYHILKETGSEEL